MPNKGLTLDEITKMGGTPVSQPEGKTFEELQALQKPAEKTPDEISAEETGAIFPAKTGEGPLAAGAKAFGNVPTSAFGFVKNVATALFNPIETAKGLGSIAKGGFETAKEKITGADIQDSSAEQTFDAFTNALKERYGSLDALQRTATNDPFAFGTDILGLVTGGAATVGKLGTVTKVIDTTGDIAKTTVLRPVTTVADNVAISQMEKALQLNPSDVRRIQLPNVANQNPSKWVLERGFQGSQETIAQDLAEYARMTKSSVDEGLANIQTPIPASELQSANQILGVLSDTFEGVPGNDVILNRIRDLAQKDTYTLSELNDIKRLVDSELGIFSRAGDIKGGATSKGLFNLRDELKTEIETIAAKNGFEDVKALNKETQVATEISKAINKRLDVSSRNLELGLRDAVLGVGAFAAGDPTFGVGAVIVKKLVESAQFRTFIANKIKTSPQKDELLNAIESSNLPLILNFFGASLNEYIEANPNAVQDQGDDQTTNP